MRKKPNLVPRMERCASVLESDPAARRGRWLSDFAGFSELHLELGCGKGRFTADMAEANGGVLFAALEKVPDAMVVAMERVTERKLGNVRFIDGDAAGCGEMFAPGEVSRIYINFPDPWLKKKQFKRRLTAGAFLRLYAALLPVGGEVWLKTDNRPLFDWSLEQFGAFGWELSEVTNDLHAGGQTGVMTDYEAKFSGQGVPINRCVARKTAETLCGETE